MKLCVVRHGQTWANLEQRYLGALDPGLTEHGREQAARLAEVLNTGIDVLVTSPLLRARQTADILGAHMGLQPLVLEAFRERNVGVYEGLTQSEARDRYPALWAQDTTRQWQLAPPGGETIAAVVERVHAGLLALNQQCAGQTVVLVAHGFVAKTARALVLGDFRDFFRWQLGNGEVLWLSEACSSASPVGNGNYARVP